MSAHNTEVLYVFILFTNLLLYIPVMQNIENLSFEVRYLD